MKSREFRHLRVATKDSVLGTCKPLKRLERNFRTDKVCAEFANLIFTYKERNDNPYG